MNQSARMRTVLLALLSAFPVNQLRSQEHGPPRGSLVVSGGAETTPEIYERFIALAGGPQALILVVPTSGNGDSFDQSCTCLTWLRKAGAKNLRLLHTRDRAVADADSFVAPLRAAAGIWFAEGNSWRHADAYLDTKVHRELFALLDRGGVIGGGSAGARIQSDYVPLRSPEPNERALPPGSWRRGFRFLRNVIIDPHVLARNRQFDLVGMVRSHPHMLGIGIDENTAIVVRGDEFEVVGGSYVVIYDKTRQVLPDTLDKTATDGGGGLFYFLRAGDRYNMKTREAVRPGRIPRPIERVAERPWPPRPA